MTWRRRLCLILQGISHAFVLHPVRRRPLHRSAAEALASDWRAVGDDMQRVMERQRNPADAGGRPNGEIRNRPYGR